MSTVLTRQRCWTHAQREAVSRCPSCKKFYCRECVTEHDGRLLCVQCLAAGTVAQGGRAGTRWVVLAAMAVLGVLVSFVVFYTAGYVLQQLPPAWTRGAEAE
ncbi:MAG: rhomboid family protein [Bryobacterales bacterium]|nr:rhomboid family protein [Bryobacterales bacterium]